MSGKGKRVRFHGAFKSKAAAMRKERQASNRFILARRIRGKRRFVVMSER